MTDKYRNAQRHTEEEQQSHLQQCLIFSAPTTETLAKHLIKKDSRF